MGIVGLGQGKRLALQPLFDRLARMVADCALDVRGQLAAVVVIEPWRTFRQEGFLQPFRFTRHLMKEHQERGNISLLHP